MRAEGDRLQAIIKKHEDSIHKLTVDLNDSKFSQGLKVEEFERSLSPGGTKSKTARQGSAMQYSFGRWTAHRADSRKVHDYEYASCRNMTMCVVAMKSGVFYLS